MLFTRRPGSGHPRQISRRKYRHIVRNAHVTPTTSSTAVQAQVTPSLWTSVSSRTTRRRLAEGHLGSRRQLRVLPLTPTHRRLILKCDDNRVRVFRSRRGRLNPAFALQRHTAPTAGVMVWGAITYNKRSPLVLIRGTMTAQWYVHDILQPHVSSLMQRLPGAIFQQDNARRHTARVSQDCLHTVNTLPWPARSPDLSSI
ncbi:transposable element Tcb2 transposase [Trichonephila clavipes]|uniref:Transposable element Tcb2 transposase n=1 Tax=Trichonephila clavipes TaxID=2585209 RepID=A0A8X6WDR7_TRICX|nr:transposable element Tcb2 transposase [Trichonephila clavipes]